MSRVDKETLKVALQDLLSDKETVREKAVKTIGSTFARKAAVLRLGKDGDKRTWLVLFQALFQAYRAQLKKCISKLGSLPAVDKAGPSDRSVGRLSETARTIRLLANNSRELLAPSVLRTILKHLTDAVASDGRLVTLVASDYAQTIASLLAWRPHLQAVHDDAWHALLAISFNIVLGRPPRRRLEDTLDSYDSDQLDDSGEAWDDPQRSPSVASDKVAGPSRLASSSLKRPRQGSSTAQGSLLRGMSASTRAVQRPSSLQGDFLRIVAMLLRSPTAPILSASADRDNSEEERDPHTFPRALLSYFSHFLRIYSVDSSLRQDYLSALSATLGHYTLNCRLPVAAFAADSWQALVTMWSTKDMEKSDDMVIALRLLLPVLTAEPLENEESVIPVDALSTLWSVAESVAGKHSSTLGNGLETLRLHVLDGRDRNTTKRAFVSQTFEHGWGFDWGRALAWAVLELQADCAVKLYLHSESTYSTPTVGRKRAKLENPIVAVLNSIRSQASRDVKIHHLQVLLFFVERHWLVLHEQLRKDIIISLTSLVAFEDAEIQSWTFLCLASIAHAECLANISGPAGSHPEPALTSLWDPVWTHAMRRANVPAVSRAACHAAHVLLLHSKALLSSQRVVGEIESFAKDLDVQGPAYPYDSVCDFMVLCLRFANQDVRLYRTQMEEKVLSWLMEAWRIDSGRKTAMPSHTVAHLHSLLEAITGSSKRVGLLCDIMLPPSPIVDAMVEERRTRVIRDFQLHAHLPPYQSPLSTLDAASSTIAGATASVDAPVLADIDTADLAPPRGRERRLSAFLLKSLEATCALLPLPEASQGRPTAETLRGSLDLSMTALFFEGSLLVNGTQSNRRVIQAACKVIGLVSPWLTDKRWEAFERRLLLGALDPLTLADQEEDLHPDSGGWEALVPPGERTGIRTEVLQKLLATSRSSRADNALRTCLKRCFFRSADVQDAFAELLKRLRDVLRLIIRPMSSDDPHANADDHDDFVPASDPTASADTAQKVAALRTHNHYIVRTCIAALVVVPILQSSSGEPTHDRELMDLVLLCEPQQFLLLGPPFLEHVRRRRLHLNRSNLKELVYQAELLCAEHQYQNNEEAQILVVQTLESTSHLWEVSIMKDPDIGTKILAFCSQCIKLLKSKGRRSWRVRDAIIRFLDNYLAIDPIQEVWGMPNNKGERSAAEDFPAAVLPTLGNDDDIRIRFRVAATTTRLFAVGRLAGRAPMDVYSDIHKRLSHSQDHFESIITRLLCLGNMVISEAAVRRGAYFHLLEVAFFTDTFRRHLKAVLMGITARLGMQRFSDLFECYASQFAFSLRQNNIDISRFPVDLLGFRDRRECAEATFRALTPTNLLAGGSDGDADTGKELFARHCQAIQKSERDGIEECFADLVAHQVTLWLHSYPALTDEGSLGAELEEALKEKTALLQDEGHFKELLQRNVDEIVVSMLRTLGDQDVSGNGPIVAALQQEAPGDAAETFLFLTKYRALDTFDTYLPNLPQYGTQVVLGAIAWCRGRVEHADSRAVTYHVLHNIFADIERSPLVNEQYRSLNALCLWISCHADHFQEECLLRLLIRRTVAMLAQSDLARSAQSLLEWSFALYRTHVAKADHRLADVLIRASTLAHEFSEAVAIPYLRKLGVELLSWLEAQAESLRKNKAMRKQVNRALAAWPRELPPTLRAVCDGLQLSDLISALNDRGISSSKFRLVRKIYEIASRGDREGEERESGSSEFWRLKACIPPEGSLLDSDIDAFTSLLILHQGRIDSLGGEKFVAETVCTRHRRLAESKASPSREVVPRADVDLARSATILSSLTMLDTAPAPQVHITYMTLRALMSTPSSDAFVDATLPSDLRREIEYLRAFRRPRDKVTVPDLPSALTTEEMLCAPSDWRSWITRLTTLLCEALGARDTFFSPLTSLLQNDPAFAEDMLPVLVHSLLQVEFDEPGTSTETSSKTLLSRYFTSVLAYADAATPCYRAIINAVLHLRSFQPYREPKDPLAHDKWLTIDFALLSRCAIKCHAYTTALLFLELAHEYASETGSSTHSAEDILFEIYSHIDEPDGFYGIQTDNLSDFFVRRLRHEKQWDKAFRYHGAVLEAGAAGSADTDGIVQSLYSFGFNRLAMNTLQHLSDSNNSLSSSALAYSLGWRAETWDLPEALAADHSGVTLYMAMRAVYRERSQHAVDNIIQRAFLHEMNRLRDLGNENFTEIRQVAQNLMCLSQVRQWRSDGMQSAMRAGAIDRAAWQNFVSLESDFDFQNVEAIMTTRISLIRSLLQKEQRDQIGDLRSPFCQTLLDLEKACLLALSERARAANEAHVALNSVVRAQSSERLPSPEVSREFSNVLWLMKEPKLAIKSLSALVAFGDQGMQLDDVSARLERASLLAQLGTWSAEASMKKPSNIVAECFAPAVEIVLSSDLQSAVGSERSAASVFHQYAIFAERQYHAVSKSPDALRWKLYIDRKKGEIAQRAQQLERADPKRDLQEYQNLRRQQEHAKRLLKQDQERAEEHLGQRTSFLASAVEMYSRCLATSDSFDEDTPIRLCSLWLENFDNDKATLGFEAAFDRVPSRKFVFLAHQLTARLWSTDKSTPARNQAILQATIQRMCREHPFHSLFPLYCLKVDRSAPHPSASSRRQSGRHAPQSSQVERSVAATDIFDKLRSDPRSAQRVQDVELVCDASLEWAKHPIKAMYQKHKPRGKPLPVPDGLLIGKINDIKVPVITAHTPIDPTMQYRDCVWISRFDSQYTTAGGVNLPKILKCLGSDGKHYKQLYKGEGDDDLRQDAVMEQVFDLVNVVLRHDRETKRRNLSVRDYKVIPLAAQAGVLEFVENTVPLADWLRPAHQRYRPQDLAPEQFGRRLSGSQGAEWRENPTKVIERFLRLREQFRPVMRHYFTEKHKTPMSWYTMRLNYARSVATNSIVGHILGVGDRHTSNILMDNKTGEVVHIDLGIAFEQGKLLPQPERVPFRLTADMIDGLGISGTQGVFQRCAEETLRVLREGSEIILTVLEVFKYDPLHSWTASELKIKRVQESVSDGTAQLTGEALRFAIGIDMAGGAADEAADRALSTVARKLDKTLSVEYTVNELVTEASDPSNLALMYVGWAPYC
ncbi:hypothetical protein OH77DRAFT_1421375 [Trametes cingulata]|nr:hypothetical protein OH77DRAFT_1421375 [Trametes cingulata]